MLYWHQKYAFLSEKHLWLNNNSLLNETKMKESNEKTNIKTSSLTANCSLLSAIDRQGFSNTWVKCFV